MEKNELPSLIFRLFFDNWQKFVKEGDMSIKEGFTDQKCYFCLQIFLFIFGSTTNNHIVQSLSKSDHSNESSSVVLSKGAVCLNEIIGNLIFSVSRQFDKTITFKLFLVSVLPGITSELTPAAGNNSSTGNQPTEFELLNQF